MVIAGIPFTMPAVWIGLIVIFLVIEGLTAGLVTIWFAVGALAALIAAMFHAPLWLQLVWFFVISIAAFAVTRPLVKKYINGRTQPTNADMLIGQECLVTEDIDNLTGHGAVTVGGKVWTARAQGDIAIAAEGARFGLTESRLGLLPAVISPYVIAAIGPRQAMALPGSTRCPIDSTFTPSGPSTGRSCFSAAAARTPSLASNLGWQGP